MMIEPRVVAHLVAVGVGEPAAKEGGDAVWLDAVDGGADEVFVDGVEVALAAKEDVGCVFDLHQAPVVARLEVPDDGAVACGG